MLFRTSLFVAASFVVGTLALTPTTAIAQSQCTTFLPDASMWPVTYTLNHNSTYLAVDIATNTVVASSSGPAPPGQGSINNPSDILRQAGLDPNVLFKDCGGAFQTAAGTATFTVSGGVPQAYVLTVSTVNGLLTIEYDGVNTGCATGVTGVCTSYRGMTALILHYAIVTGAYDLSYTEDFTWTSTDGVDNYTVTLSAPAGLDAANGRIPPIIAGAPQYSLTDLGTLGGTISEATGISSSAQVTGWANTSTGVQHGFVYTVGTGMTDIGTLPGGASSQGYAINDSGQVTGFSYNASGTLRAFLYSNGVPGYADGMTDLGTLPGGTSSNGFGINDNGQVAGWSTLSAGSSDAFCGGSSQTFCGM